MHTADYSVKFRVFHVMQFSNYLINKYISSQTRDKVKARPIYCDILSIKTYSTYYRQNIDKNYKIDK